MTVGWDYVESWIPGYDAEERHHDVASVGDDNFYHTMDKYDVNVENGGYVMLMIYDLMI